MAIFKAGEGRESCQQLFDNLDYRPKLPGTLSTIEDVKKVAALLLLLCEMPEKLLATLATIKDAEKVAPQLLRHCLMSVKVRGNFGDNRG